MLASWALKVYLIQMLVFQIFNLPSHPTVAKQGGYSPPFQDLIQGEYLTQETQSQWFLSSDSYFFYPMLFHKIIFLSAPAERIYLLSAEMAQVKTSLVCPSNLQMVVPFLKSHNLKVLSQEEVKAYPLVEVKAKSEMK